MSKRTNLKIAVFAVTLQGAHIGAKLSDALGCTLYLPGKLSGSKIAADYYCEELHDKVTAAFAEFDGLVFVMAVGIVVRMIAPHVKNKYEDPAVVAVDDAARYAISLLSGHEGGANALAARVSTILNADFVVTTATDTNKNLVAGVGCRRGATKEPIIQALETSFTEAGLELDSLRLIATIDIKKDEQGLVDAAAHFGVPVKFFSADEINSLKGDFSASEFVEENVGVKCVCEPCAFLAARRGKLVVPKSVVDSVTVAIVQEEQGE